MLGIDAYVMAGLLPGIASSFGVSASAAGQTVSVFTIFYAVSAPVFGTLTAGRPVRDVLCAALAVFVVANALSASVGSFPLLLATRAVAGVGAGLYSPAAFGAAGRLVDLGRRGRALGLVVGGLVMGTALGVPCGLLLADRLGWRATLWLVAALGMAALAGTWLRLPPLAATTIPSLRQRVAVLADSRVGATIAVSVLTSAGSIGLYTYVAQFLLAYGEIGDTLPYLWAWSLGGLIGIYPVGMLIDATGRSDLVMAAVLVALSAAFVVLGLGPANPIVLLCCFALWGAAAWSSQAPQQHRLLSLHPENGSVVLALQSSAHYAGSAAGAALGGVALVAGASVHQLPLLAACLIAAAMAGQLGIASARGGSGVTRPLTGSRPARGEPS